MKMIEALKEKKLNQKKVAGVIGDIQKYSSITSVEKPAFETEKEQTAHVKQLVQSGLDLLKRRAQLKMLIDKTNLETMIKIPKGLVFPEHEISIAEALMFKLNYNEYVQIYSALSRNTAASRLRSMPSLPDGTKAVEIQLYEESWKNNSLKDLMMKHDYIDAHLEMLNATVDVVE